MYARVTPPPYPIGKGILVGAAYVRPARRMNSDEIEIQTILLSKPRRTTWLDRLVRKWVRV